MELLARYLQNRLEAWTGLLDEALVASLAFLALLGLIHVLRRGPWSRRLVLGGLATVALWHANVFFAPLLHFAMLGVRGLYAQLGIPQLPPTLWAGVPAPLLALLALVAYDFVDYWNHRLMHLPWLWPIHAIHHSDPDVTALTTFRVHLLEAFVMLSTQLFFLSWLGLPALSAGFGVVLARLHNMYVHVNVDLHHGPFRLWLASPRFHRWHHADVPEAHGKNLANVIPLFDRLFGTYYCPGRCEVPLGAAGVPENHVLKLLLFPFASWLASLRGLLSKSASSAASEP